MSAIPVKRQTQQHPGYLDVGVMDLAARKKTRKREGEAGEKLLQSYLLHNE